jgi:UDP-glucose 4-epimerase
VTSERVLITGGAGFIGSHLAGTLLAAGKQVTVLDDLSTGRLENVAPLADNPRFRSVVGSVIDRQVLDPLVRECELIVHLAAAVGVELVVREPVRTIETNVTGTEAVLAAALRHRVKILLASSSEVYGRGARQPLHENDDVVLGPSSRSRWAYAATKLVGEFLALAYHSHHGLPVVVFRLFNTVGPRQTGRYGMVVPRFVGQCLQGLPVTVYGDGEQCRCFCDVRDAVRAIAALAEHPGAVGRLFNVGGTEEITIRELALRVIDQTGSSSQIVTVPYDEAYAPGFDDMTRRLPDTSSIRDLVGWAPRIPLEQTIAAVRDHLVEHPETLGASSA